MLKNTRNAYGLIARSFHWSMSFIIIGIIIAGFIMTSLEPGDQKWFVYAQHKAFGVLILVLIPLRLVWRLMNTQPLLPKTLPLWQKKVANLNIVFLYFCMLMMPLSGFIMSTFSGKPISLFGLYTITPFFEKHTLSQLSHDFHSFLAWGIAGALIIHIAAALYHHFVLKDKVLKRMV